MWREPILEVWLETLLHWAQRYGKIEFELAACSSL